MIAQPREDALKEAASIRHQLQALEGRELGHGLVFHGGALVSSFPDDNSPYLPDDNGQPATFFHYRNLSTVAQPGSEDFHDLMHFGGLRAAHSRAFSKRLLQGGDQQFSEKLLCTDRFNQCVHTPVQRGSDFGNETIFSVKLKAKNPYFIPDIGQTDYFRNRAVLYASGLFDEDEVDADLFDGKGMPQDDIDSKVLQRLRDRGYDCVAYLNEIEDPDSLSLIILSKDQAEPVPLEETAYPGFRYRFGPPGSTQVVECDPQKNIRIVDTAPPKL